MAKGEPRAKTKKPVVPGTRRKVQRTSFRRDELPEVYRRRNFLPSGERPKGRTFAMTYSELAKHYRCDTDTMADACATAAAMVRAGTIVRIGTRFVLA